MLFAHFDDQSMKLPGIFKRGVLHALLQHFRRQMTQPCIRGFTGSQTMPQTMSKAHAPQVFIHNNYRMVECIEQNGIRSLWPNALQREKLLARYLWPLLAQPIE